MVSWHDANGNQMVNTYDSDGRVIAQDGTDGIMSAGLDYVTTGDGSGSVTVLTDSVGTRTGYGFDQDLRLRDVQLPSGARTHTDFNQRRDPLQVTSPDGAVTRYLYTPDGDVAALTRPDGATVRIEYAAPGRPSAIHNVDGSVIRHEWDDQGNLVAVTDPRGARTEYGYRGDGALETIGHATGGQTQIRCDAAGLPIQVVDPAGAATFVDRDPFGRPTTVTDPLGETTTYEWSGDGKLLRRGNPDATHDSWDYDGEGNLLRHTGPGGEITAYTYGAFDLLATRTDPDGTVTSYTWDTERRLTGVTNPLGQSWTYEYDTDGRLVAEIDFNGALTSYTHDVAGRVATVTPATGSTRRLRYDGLGQLIETRADTGEFRTYTYDLGGRRTTAISGVHDAVTHTVRFDTTTTGLLVGESIDDWSVLRFSHDAVGRRVSRSSSSGGLTTWQWKPTGDVSMMQVDGRPMGFDHDVRGALTNWRVGELAVSRAYDGVGRLTQQQALAHPVRLLDLGLGGADRPDPQVIRADEYAYRPDGFLSGQQTSTPSGSRVRTYDLDESGRVTHIMDGDTTAERYSYDALSNVVGEHVGLGDGAAIDRREFRGTLLVADGRTRFSYDAAGRLVRKTVRRLSRPADVWHYGYDAFDQLTSVTTPDGTRWAYTYDALGRRITKARLNSAGDAEETTRFVWDGHTVVEQQSLAETMRWSYRPGTHTPLTQTRVRGEVDDQDEVDAEFFAIVTDLVGTPTELVEPDSGDVVGHASSTLWGSTTWSGADTPIRFPGQYFDAETGWHYNLHRYYSPETARYVTQDPLGLVPSPNPMAYPFNPTAWVDPLGLVPEPCLKDTPIEDARRVSGRFPESAEPNEILFRANGSQVTSYQVYDTEGLPVQRVDVTGRTHGGVPTPHVMEFERHFDPSGNLHIKESKVVRPATPEEVGGLR
ncbi:RHS repeat-associated core domain-containing protein [Gordonia sp. LSe1-13]|uniref:RHS repeat-associated core domain-containing protein n=1 Tax=Gordonia sesuvii TaxID=3116777 RepID=A0ABU7M9F1_9ACTN|nr:RHS repeat-associated core domain-containing protein [Gordonia sp. LSe1-13]